jgi:hypothetical protein
VAPTRADGLTQVVEVSGKPIGVKLSPFIRSREPAPLPGGHGTSPEIAGIGGEAIGVEEFVGFGLLESKRPDR